MAVLVFIDEEGRVQIPMNLLEKVGIKLNSNVTIRIVEKCLVIEPCISTAEKYYGIYKTETLPDDLDAFLERQIFENWKKREEEIQKLNGASSGI